MLIPNFKGSLLQFPYNHMGFISQINIHTGQNSELCSSAHGLLPRMLQYIKITKLEYHYCIARYMGTSDCVMDASGHLLWSLPTINRYCVFSFWFSTFCCNTLVMSRYCTIHIPGSVSDCCMNPYTDMLLIDQNLILTGVRLEILTQ